MVNEGKHIPLSAKTLVCPTNKTWSGGLNYGCTAPMPVVSGGKHGSPELCPAPSGQEPKHFSIKLFSYFLGREWRQCIAQTFLRGSKLLGSPVPVYLSSGPSRRTLWMFVSPHKQFLECVLPSSVVLKCCVLPERALKHCMINGNPAKKHTSKIDCIYFPEASVSADFFGARHSFS